MHQTSLSLLGAAVLACAALLPAPAAQSASLFGSGSSCDPTKASCVPPPGGSPFPTFPPGGGGGGGGGTCTAPPGGSPSCGGSGPASVGGGSSGGTMVGGGNPINLITGNKYQEETDLAALPGVLGLELKRYYNSLSPNAGIVGAQWRLSYETVLVDLGSQIQILQADGRRITLTKGHGGTLCTSPQLSDGQVRIEQQGGQPVYHWRWADGRVLTFMAVNASAQGRGFPLHSITAATGERVQLSYNPMGDLISVVDPQGRKLSFIYGRAGAGQRALLQAIESPLGRIGYRQDDHGRLTEVVQSAALTRRYHYEAEHNGGNEFALTGISAVTREGAQRLSTYAYDSAGLAVLSTKGRPLAMKDGKPVDGTGIEQIRVQYVAKPSPQEGTPDKTGEVQVKPERLGRVVLTNSLGQTTEITTAIVGGGYRLVSMRGPGCSTCGPSNRSHGYDREGRLIRTTELDANGRPQAAELRRYDSRGRLVRTERQAFVDGKPQAAQLLQRWEYTDVTFKDGSVAVGLKATLVAQPSVIAGKERTTAFEYNEFGQAVKVTQAGWSPVNEQGEPVAQGVQIKRTTTYSYKTINGRSLLAQVDGPLANGPKGDPSDSDVTRFEWDAQGRMQAASAPGGMAWAFVHTPQGWLKQMTVNDGHRLVRTDWQWQANGAVAAQPLNIQRSAWQLDAAGKAVDASRRQVTVLRAEYDERGRRTVLHGDGGGDDGAKMLRYDEGGRPQTMRLPDGSELHWAFDSESRPLAATQTAADGQVQGARAWLRDAQGQVLATLYPGGRLQLQALLPADGLARPLDEVLAARRGDGGSARIRLRDDFDREVLSRDPEDGQIATTFSTELRDGVAFERQRQIRTGTDGRSRVEESLYFDTAQRLRLRGSSGDGAASPCEEAFVYEGRLLKAIQGCGMREDFARDSLGLITAHGRTLGDTRIEERFAYDAQGRLVLRVLPDAQVLRYGGPRQAKPTVARLRPWLQGIYGSKPSLALSVADFLPHRWGHEDLVESMQGSAAAGLTALTHGNGVRTTWAGAPTDPATAVRTTGGEVARMKVHWPLAARPALLRPAEAAEASLDAFGRRSTFTPTAGPFAGLTLGLQWNERHELVALRLANGQPAAEYRYDAAGNRTSKTVHLPGQAAQTTRFVYDTHHRLIAVIDASGQPRQQYLYADHRAHTLLRGAEALAVSTDWRGLPLQLSDADGKAVWRAEESTWGEARGGDAPALRLAGQVFDEESGLHYNVHRYLDTRTGRYLSPDPTGTPDGPDRYAYLRGRPESGIDPLGLFEIPVSYFFNQGGAFDKLPPVGDDGHGDIVRAAFAIYQAKEGNRFSKFFIDQVILNNYQSDALDTVHPFYKSGPGGGPGVAGGGQFNPLNHFDNPHDGPMCKDAACTTLGDGYSLDWIKNSHNQIEANRGKYVNVDPGDGRGDISPLLGAFGQNSHALADFYAHSNWVDGVDRGGKVVNKYKEDGKEKLECGYVPVGKDMRTIWDEDMSDGALRTLYTGTVQLGESTWPLPDYDTTNKVCGDASSLGKGDIVCTKDKTTHGYWGKDHDGTMPDEKGFTAKEKDAFSKAGSYFWEVSTYNGSPPSTDVGKAVFGNNWLSVDGKDQSELKKGDKVLVARTITNRHRLAFSLAVAHTVKEIEKLYADSAGKMVGSVELRDVFLMNQSEIGSAGVEYKNRTSKTGGT